MTASTGHERARWRIGDGEALCADSDGTA
jgi:hypothetical protein